MEHDPEVMRICVAGYLREAGAAGESALRASEALERTRAAMDGLAARTGPPTKRQADRMAELAAECERAEDELAARAADALDAMRAMTACDAGDGRRACWLHWAERRTWAQAARMLGYSESHVKRLAYAEVAGIYDEMPEEHRRKHVPNAEPG